MDSRVLLSAAVVLSTAAVACVATDDVHQADESDLTSKSAVYAGGDLMSAQKLLLKVVNAHHRAVDTDVGRSRYAAAKWPAASVGSPA